MKEFESGANAAEGRKPVRASPLLGNQRMARLVRDLFSEARNERVLAARELRHIAGKGGDISEAFPAVLASLRQRERDVADNLLWAARYAHRNGFDISNMLPSIAILRNSGDGTTRGLATIICETAGG